MSAVGSFLWTEPMLLELQQRLRKQRTLCKPSRGECLAALEAWRRERDLLSELLELLRTAGRVETLASWKHGTTLAEWADQFEARRFRSGVVAP